MINRVVLIGRLTKDVELRRTANNLAVCSFTLAVENRYQNKESGERTASFISCVAWQGTAESLANHVRKGSQICVEGRLQQRSYDTKEGRKASVTEVICELVQFLGPKQESPIQPQESGFSIDSESTDYSEEDLPF